MKKIRGTSLLIGKVIADELKNYIAVYPIVAPQDTKFPFAVYKRTGLSFRNTKDIYNTDEIATMELVIVSQSYVDGLQIATDLKMFLEHLQGDYKTTKEEEIRITDISIVDASEEWNNEAYLQKMTLQITMSNDPD